MNDERLTGSPFLTLKPLGMGYPHWPAALADLASVSHHPKGSRLSQVGDRASDIIFLMKGSIMDSIANTNGLEKCTLTFAPYPHWLAPAWHGLPLLYASTAYTDVTLWHISREKLSNIMKESPDFLSFIMRFFALESRRLYHQSYLQYTMPSTMKIAQTLAFYHYLREEEVIPDLRLTQSLIAQLSGVHRTSVAQSLQALRSKGLIGNQPASPLTRTQGLALEEYAFKRT